MSVHRVVYWLRVGMWMLIYVEIDYCYHRCCGCIIFLCKRGFYCLRTPFRLSHFPPNLRHRIEVNKWNLCTHEGTNTQAHTGKYLSTKQQNNSFVPTKPMINLNEFENPMNCSQCLIEWVLLTDDWSWNGNKNRIRRNFVHKITVNCEIKQFKVLKNKGMIQKLEPQFPLIIIFFCVTIIISCFPILSV